MPKLEMSDDDVVENPMTYGESGGDDKDGDDKVWRSVKTALLKHHQYVKQVRDTWALPGYHHNMIV